MLLIDLSLKSNYVYFVCYLHFLYWITRHSHFSWFCRNSFRFFFPEFTCFSGFFHKFLQNLWTSNALPESNWLHFDSKPNCFHVSLSFNWSFFMKKSSIFMQNKMLHLAPWSLKNAAFKCQTLLEMKLVT